MNYPVIPEDTNELYFQMNGDKDKGLSYLNAIKGSFNLHRETDNKKSWASTDSDVEHEDQNLDTSYTALGDRMIINCKEYCFVINRQKILDIYAEENNGVVDPLFEEIVDQQIKRIEEIYIPFVKKHLIPATAIEQCEPNFIIMDLSISKVDQTHNCVEDGEATVTITGGAPPFTYLWSTGGTGDTITGLAEGEYSVTVTDSTGTSISGSVTINKLFDAPTLTGSISEITSSSMKVIPAGGTGPYTYEWFKGGDCEPETAWRPKENSAYCIKVEKPKSRFQMTFGSSSNPVNKIILPTIETGNYDFNVDWGDGTSDTINTWNDPSIEHDYSEPGIYQVSITGLYDRQEFNHNDYSKYSLVSVDNFGDVGWADLSRAFYGCDNLEYVAPIEKYEGTRMVETFMNIRGPGLHIHPDLFKECPNLITCNGVFSDTIFATDIPSTLFDYSPNINDFRYAFREVTANGQAPELWLRTNPVPDGYFCFYLSTDFTNYSSIPSDWK